MATVPQALLSLPQGLSEPPSLTGDPDVEEVCLPAQRRATWPLLQTVS